MSDMTHVSDLNYEALKAQRDMLVIQRDTLIRKIRDLEERAVSHHLGFDTGPGWYGTITSSSHNGRRQFDVHRFGPFATMLEAQTKIGEWMQTGNEWVGFRVEYNAGVFTVGDPDEQLAIGSGFDL